MFKFADYKKIILSLIAVVFIILIAVISFKFYPIAFVGFRPVIYANLMKDYNAAIIYYAKAVETYNKNNADIINSSEVRNEIKRAALESSIEDILISNELNKLFSGTELKNQLDKNVNEAVAGKDIEKEIETLYGLSKEAFTARFLKPQARKDILEARLRLENNNFDSWIENAEKQASVLIFLPGFEWKDGTVVVKK